MRDLNIRQDLSENYENYYDGDSIWRQVGAEGKANNIISLCQDIQHDKIIEIGAGEGSILKRLSELGFGIELFAIEISPSGITAIKNKAIPRLVECKLFDGYHIPYGDNQFDIAILSHVVEHVEHPRQLLYEASRIAKYIFVEVPLEDTFRLSKDFHFDSVGHINFYSPKTIRRLLQTCNLKVIHQITINRPKAAYSFSNGKIGLINYYVKELLLRLMPGIATRLFTYHGALICENINHS